MKKFFAVMLIALVVVSGAFAGFGAKKGPDMMVGGKTGYGMDMTFTKVGDKTITGKTHSIPVEATFSVDFADIPVYATVDLGTEVKIVPIEGADSKTYAEFALNAGAGYRYDVNTDLALKAGLVFSYGLWSDSVEVLGVKTTTTTHSFGLALDLDVNYDLTDNVVLFGGLDLGGVLGGMASVKVGDAKATTEADEVGTNLSFGINVGAAYKF